MNFSNFFDSFSESPICNSDNNWILFGAFFKNKGINCICNSAIVQNLNSKTFTIE